MNDPACTFKGSISGGGRYDDLTDIFGMPGVSGVGISFGADRIYDVMEECKLFDQLNINSSVTKLLFVNFGNEEEKHCLKLLKQQILVYIDLILVISYVNPNQQIE